MDISKRISVICKQKKIKQIDLVTSGFGSKQTVNQILNGKQLPNTRFLEKLLSTYTDIDARWLITGTEASALEEPREHYGYCKECIKKEAIIEHLKEELEAKEKRIEDLIRQQSLGKSTEESLRKQG